MRFYKQKKCNYLAYILLCLPLLNAKTIKVEEILLSGDITNPGNEISGMDWHQGLLFMIPENLNNFIYAIPKIEIDNYFLSTKPIPIIPKSCFLASATYWFPGPKTLSALAIVLEPKAKAAIAWAPPIL